MAREKIFRSFKKQYEKPIEQKKSEEIFLLNIKSSLSKTTEWVRQIENEIMAKGIKANKEVTSLFEILHGETTMPAPARSNATSADVIQNQMEIKEFKALDQINKLVLRTSVDTTLHRYTSDLTKTSFEMLMDIKN